MKSLFLWIAGVGFTGTQVFFYLTQTWAKVVFLLISAFLLFVLSKLPKELHLLFWICLTVIMTILYYILKPEGSFL